MRNRKRHIARLYIIECNDQRQVYYEALFRYQWIAYVALMLSSLELTELQKERVIQLAIEITPIAE